MIPETDESASINCFIGVGVKKKTRFRAQLDRLDAASDLDLSTSDRIHLSAICRESLSAAEKALNDTLPGIYAAYGIEKCLKVWLNRINLQTFFQQAAATWLALDYYHARQFQPTRSWKHPKGAEALQSILVDRLKHYIQADLGQLLTHMAAMLALPDPWLSTSRWSKEIKAGIEQQSDFSIKEIDLEVNLPPGGLAWIEQVTYAQWNFLRKQIDAGNPWPITLIGYTLNPHHQKTVVAYGYEGLKEGIGRILVYDPSCPQSGQHIQINFRSHPLVLRESCINRHSEALFGFLCCGYTRLEPPKSKWNAILSKLLPLNINWHIVRWLRLCWLRVLRID